MNLKTVLLTQNLKLSESFSVIPHKKNDVLMFCSLFVCNVFSNAAGCVGSGFDSYPLILDFILLAFITLTNIGQPPLNLL